MLDRRPIYIALAGAVVLAAALALTFALDDDGDDPGSAARSPAAGESSSPPPSPPPPSPPEAAASPFPSFDVVRINRDGNAVIAGRAAPGAVVVILDGATELGRVDADGRGEWVFVPQERLPPGQRELSLTASVAGGEPLASKDVVVLSVPESPDSGTALAVRMDREGGRTLVLQGSGTVDGGKAPTIDAVDYRAEGEVSLSGRAKPGSVVQVYVDNLLFGSAQTGADGRWAMEPTPGIAAGPHTVRVDQIGEAGRVEGRAEIPFERAEPSTIPKDRSLVVQPGNSLWRIARRTYGSGFAYTDIYAANRERIRDPDLIYPGQVFVLPPGREEPLQR